MTSPHRFIADDRNAASAAGATVAASSILPAESTAFPLPRTRQGTARAIVTGGYTGADDAELEIEIVSATGSGLLSAPTFAGAGNGTLSNLAATGMPAQTFTLLLASTGIPTKPAATDFFGVKLLARAAGAAGNGIEITVATAGLGATATGFSFLEEVRTGDSEFTGPQWDFGGYPLTVDGEIDPRTPRLRFGDDPQIYRQYKVFANGDWTYLLDPPLVRKLPAGTGVFNLTGTYTVTVSQGATIETYANLVTLFDLLNALKTRSSLVEVSGVVIEDKTPGGMAAEDLPLRTAAYALPAIYTGNAAFPGLGPVTVPAAAPTQIITLTCADISTLGSELWTVKGSVSGALPESTTGVPYTTAGYGWTVPKVLPETLAAPTGKIYVKDIQFATRSEPVAIELCIAPLVAGAAAKSKTIEVVYTPKPPAADCPCAAAAVTGRLDATCLGVQIDGATTMAIAAGYQTRLATLYGWRANFITTNTAITAQGELRAAELDIQLADIAVRHLAKCLADLYALGDAPPTAALTAWDSVQIGLDNDLTPLETLGSDEPTVNYSFVDAYNRITTPLVEGSIYNFVASDGTVHRYKLVEAAVIGTPILYGSPPSHTNGGLVVKDWGGTEGDANYVWQDLGPVGDIEDVNNAAAMLGDPGISRDPALFAARYAARMDEVRALAGIVPKSEASGDGSACWQPCNGEFEWRVNGMEYLPACTNMPYHSCIRQTDVNGREVIVSTQEFGFVICCACPDRLIEGDRFTLVIENDAAPVKTYAIGDTINLPIVAAAPLELAGGQNGNDTLTWTVRGSAGGSWPDYVAPIGAEPLYNQSGLQFRVKQGGIPFALGDAFTFAIAGGTFRWRLDAGAWSGNVAIGTAPAALQDGLSVLLSPGPDPAFVAGDAWAFAVKQPHAPALARSPSRGAWRWAGSGATWTASFAADAPVSAVAIWHDCPAGATFTAQGLSAADAVLWTRAVAWRAGLTVAIFEGGEAVADCRKVRLTVAGATGGSVRWFWCGAPWIPAHEAASVSLRESWRMARGVSAARYGGRGAAGEIAWDVERSWLDSADWAELLALLDHLKSHHDEPLVFVPSAAHPAEARLVRIGVDEVDASDYAQFLYDPRRAISVRVPLSAVPL